MWREIEYWHNRALEWAIIGMIWFMFFGLIVYIIGALLGA
jgi:hypothetical protein